MHFTQILLLLLTFASYCFAVSASNETFLLEQPDGSTIEVRNVGDESGESSEIYAHGDNFIEYRVPAFVTRRIQRLPPIDHEITTGELRGLILLVQFSDVKFKSSDPQKLYTDFFNKQGFNEVANHGSVRDYFIQNSLGKFTPSFDVYGPITVPGTRSSYGCISKENKNYNAARKAFKEAIDTLIQHGEIDFSKYDKNNDGDIDFFFVVYAGVGASNSPVIESIWPHAGYMGRKGVLNTGKLVAPGYHINRYACANEISGRAYKSNSNTSVIEGVGFAIHELGHVLGLPDLYDTKQTNSHKSPGTWAVMADGDYNCPANTYNTQACSPPFYTAFERMSLGWLTPTELNEIGEVKLEKIENNVAYSITNPKNPDEMYLLEYRSKKDWDQALKNSGMLVWHIDYVDSIWNKAIINADSNHMYVDIIEAVPEKVKYTTADESFPGSANVTFFNKFVFWDGTDMGITLSNITEAPDYEYVTFNVDMIVRSSSSVESSSSESSSSSTAESSSSEIISSSSFSSSSIEISSSSATNSSSSTAESSSSRTISSSSADVSSSSIDVSSSSEVTESSSSQDIESSSSDGLVSIAHKLPMQNVQVRTRNGSIYIYAPQQGKKTVRLFSPLGALLLEKTMDGNELTFDLRHLQNTNVILSVTQGQTTFHPQFLRF